MKDKTGSVSIPSSSRWLRKVVNLSLVTLFVFLLMGGLIYCAVAQQQAPIKYNLNGVWTDQDGNLFKIKHFQHDFIWFGEGVYQDRYFLHKGKGIAFGNSLKADWIDLSESESYPSQGSLTGEVSENKKTISWQGSNGLFRKWIRMESSSSSPPSIEDAAESPDLPENERSPISTPTPSTGKVHVVIASREIREEAVRIAQNFEDRYSTEVYLTANGWYAVTLGAYPKERALQVVQRELESGQIKDNGWWLSEGKTWGERVYP